MGTNYLYGTVITGEGVAANNRGDNLGNTTTLQKVFVKDEVHTSVSAEAIRFAIRYRFQREELSVRRKFIDGKLEESKEWNPEQNIDDDLMGYMDAAAAQAEREEEDEGSETESGADKPRKGRKKAKGKTTKRQSPLAVSRAVSVRPYRGEISFNAVSGEKEKGKLSLYSAEMHTTEYQYSFGLNLDDVVNQAHIEPFIDAIVDPPQVAGNHSRFAYDFSPSSIVLRVTSAHSPRIQNCFEHDEESRGITIRKLVERVRSGDIPAAAEIIVGGEIASTVDGKALESLGAKVVAGVSEAAAEARIRIKNRFR